MSSTVYVIQVKEYEARFTIGNGPVNLDLKLEKAMVTRSYVDEAKATEYVRRHNSSETDPRLADLGHEIITQLGGPCCTKLQVDPTTFGYILKMRRAECWKVEQYDNSIS